MIRELIEFVDSQPRTVVAALFAVIVVGGVGGGIWIKTLVSATNTSEQRISLVKAQYDKAEATLTQENLLLTEQLDILKPRMTVLSSELRALSDLLNNLSKSDSVDASTVSSLMERANTLKEESASIQAAFKRADEMKAFAEKIRMAQVPHPSSSAPSFVLVFLVILLAVIFVLITLRVRRGSS